MHKKEIQIFGSSKKGFTLVELLAVIVILAVILAIAVPSISSLISKSTRNALEADAKMLLKQIDYKSLEDSSFDSSGINETNLSQLGLSNSNYSSLQFGKYFNKSYVIITGRNKWANLKACGTFNNIKVVDASDTTTCAKIPNEVTVCAMRYKNVDVTCDPSSLSSSCIGEISLLPYNFDPVRYYRCDGTAKSTTTNAQLFSLIGSSFGGDGVNTFMVPNLASSIPAAGLRYDIAYDGNLPTWSGTSKTTVGEYKYFCDKSPYQRYLIGEIKLASNVDESEGNMLLANGRSLPVMQYPALYSLLGNMFGGNTTNFNIPNLSAATPPVAGMNYYIVINGEYPLHP